MTANYSKFAATAILFSAILLFAGRVDAQEPATSPGQVREALRIAIEFYKRGEFEKASDYFQFVQTKQQSLARPEQDDLSTFGMYNANALKARQEGAQQLRLANEAVQKGKTNEAAPYLNALNSNQYLSQTDKKQLEDLNRRMQSQLTGKAEAPPLKGDPKTFLANGRAALQAGDLNAAETWANQAEKAKSWTPQWMQFGDSPAKLRSDIQSARAKMQQPLEPTAKKDPDNKDSSWLPSMKWFAKGDPQPDPTPKMEEPTPIQKKDDPAPMPTPKKDETSSKFAGLWPFGGSKDQAPAKKDAPEDKVDAMIARQVVKDGFLFLEGGDLEKARFLAIKAKELKVKWDPNERTPDLLLHEIQRRSTASQPPTPPMPAPNGAPPFNAANGQVNVGVNPGPVAPFPAAPDAGVKTGDAAPFPRHNEAVKKPVETDPRVLLRQGRAQLGLKKLDEADKLCAQANAIKTNWGLWEDNPDKLRKDITSARRIADRDESVKLLVESRKLMTQGKFDEAEKDAYKAKQMHGPYGVFDFGDRPDKLLEEIAKARQTAARSIPPREAPKENALAKEDKNKFTPPPEVPPGIQNANKNRAVVMLREARELERREMLVEARQKALEARALRASFQPDEDSPEHLLLSLSAACDRQITANLKGAVEAFSNANDPQRFDKSQAQLMAARRLAQVFNLDPGRIDQTTQYLHQVASGGRAITAVATDMPATQDPFRVVQAADQPTGDPQKDALRKIARERLRDAQTELSHGRYGQARKMAEDLYNPAYGIQEEVVRFLHTINAEETNQEILAAMRNFEVGVDAVAAKDYRKAMAIFQQIDIMMLPEKHQNRLRDIMGMREMQPGQLAKVERTPLKAGLVEITPQAYEGPIDGQNDLLNEFKAAEAVQFQALRARGVEALRKAHELWKQDRPEAKEQALATLKGYVEQVNLAGLEQPKSNDLRRAVETRIQQYTALQAEAKMTKIETAMRYTSFHDESARTRKITERQEEVTRMMKNAQELLNENKLKEAAAEARKVLEIDPENGAALALKTIAVTRENQQYYDKEVFQSREWMVKAVPDGLGKMVDEKVGVDFDPERLKRHKDTSGHVLHELRDPRERAIQSRLRQPTSLKLKDVPLRQAIEAVALQSGLQVVPDDLALQEARINMDSPLSISVEDIDLRSALNILLRPLRLTYIIEDQVLKITTENRTVGRLVRITYPIGDLIVPVEDHPLPDIFNIQKALEKTFLPQGFGGASNFLTPSPYVMSPGVPVSSDNLGSAFGGKVAGHQGNGPGGGAASSRERTKEQMAEILKDLIKNTIAKDKWDDMGGNGSIQYFPMGLALVINQNQEVQEEIQTLLATLRKLQDLQVSVELRAVLVSETFFERIGVDFNVNIQTPTSQTESTLTSGNFVPAPFVNRVGKGLNLVSGLTQAGTLTPDLNVPIQNSTFAFTTPQFGGYQPQAGLNVGLAFLSDIQVFMFLQAVQGDRRAHIMQAPKITVYNGQQAFISGNMVRPSVTGLNPVPLANGQMIMIPNIAPIPFGLAMQVQPVVSPDRRFIRLNVTPIMANGIQDPAGAIVVAVPSVAQGQFDGGVAQPPFANSQVSVTVNPTQSNLNILNTTVNVPDGGTVLLGGFKFLAEERTEYGPPILSNIPYLSRLFRNVGWSRDGSTLIYLVTARVIMIEEEERIFLGELAPIPGR